MLRKFKWVRLLVSLVLAAFICQNKGNQWEEKVRDGLYALLNDSIPNFAVDRVDDQGIPFVFYPTQNGITPGKQYNATIVANAALLYFDSLQQHPDAAIRNRFFNCIHWLANEMEDRDSLALFIFRWRQPWYPKVLAPFTSGMTSGQAIRAFVSAFQLDGDSSHLSRAILLTQGYFLPMERGGFTIKEPHGWWYEEIADTALQTPRILDGHLFAMLGLQHLYAATHHADAKVLFDSGMRSLKHFLPSYDAGHGEIFYDKYGKLADKKYKAIVTQQLQQLYEITGDADVQFFYNKWMAPLQKPYVYRMLKEKNRSGIILFVLISMATFLLLLVLQWLFQKYRT